MTVAVLLIFATCIASGTGLTFHSDLAMRAEERFFGGWVIGIITFTICGIVSTRLFSFSGSGVTVACAGALTVSATGWRRGIDQWAREIASFKDRVKSSLRSGDNPFVLLFLLLPMWFLIGRMFSFAYQIGDDGAIMVGHLASFSDWQAHLTYTASFAYADNTGLNLPLSTGDNIGYHAGINYFAALLIPAGASLPGALQLSGAFTLFAFPGVMYSIGMRVFRQQAVAMLGTALFLFLGGWGFIEFFKDIGDGASVLSSIPQTYTRLPDVPPAELANWWNSNPIVLENPIVGHFFPQRPTMIGFPIVLLILGWLYTAWNQTVDHQLDTRRTLLFCGVLAGLTPFFNLFAFGTPMAFVGIWWIATRFRREWLYFLVPAAILAAPVVLFLQPPSSSVDYSYDWVQNIRNPAGVPDDLSLISRIRTWIVFWFRNLGLFLPLLVIAQATPGILSRRIALGLLPVWLFFIVPNMIRPHPWNGNNTHYFIFVMLLGALPVAALLISVSKRFPFSIGIVALVTASMMLSGFVDVLVTNDRDTSPWPLTAMDSGGVAVAEWARTTDPESVFVIELGWAEGNASPHQHPVPALSGRDLVIGNDGWVFDLGIEDWFIRKDHSRIILEAGAGHEQLLDTYDVDYLVIGPDSRTPNWDPNIAFWEEEADVVYRHAGWTVYEV